MATARSIAPPPNTLAALGFAVVSTLAFTWLMSSGGNGVMGSIKFVAVLTLIVLSTRYSIRAYRRLAEMEFELSHALRWLPLLMALAANAFTCFLIACIALIALGVTLTGRGMVG